MSTLANQKQLSSFELAAILGGSTAVVIGVMGLLGWISGQPVLISFGPDYIPIAFSTCFACLIQGAVLILHIHCPRHARHYLPVVLVSATAIFGALAFIGYFANSDLNFEAALSPSRELFAQFPVNRMSPLTGMLFFFSGASLLVLLLKKPGKPAANLAGALAIPVALTGLTGTMGYLYGTPLLYVGPIIPMALSTCTAFMFLGFGLIAATGPGASLLSPLTGSSIRAMLLRTFVPLGFAAVIGSNILQHAVTSLNSALVSAVSAVLCAMATVIVVVQAARRTGSIIEKAESERVLAEKELMQAKQDWERTFNSVPDLIALLDTQHRITRVNNAMADRLGLTPEQCIGARCHDVVHGESEAPAFCPHVLTCRDGREHIVELHEPHLGGHFLVSTSPIFNEQKELIGVVHVARDITRHKQAEEDLREAHDRLNAIVEFLPDATFVIDGSGKIIAWNRAVKEMTGVSKAEMLQMGDYAYAIPFYGERRPVLIDLLLKPEPELELRKYDYIQRHGDVLYGETFVPNIFGGKGAFIWSAASVLRDSSGNMVGAIQSLRDITERKHAEAERLRLEQQLLQVQKAESLGRMAGSIAHHFNNKLMAVMGNLELAISHLPQESSLRANLIKAMITSQQAAEISILMLACIGQTAEKKDPLDFVEAIKETFPALRTSLPQNILLKTGLPDQGPTILADSVHIKQILTNLVLNASEAIGDSEGEISVGISMMSPEQFRESKVYPPDWKPKAKGYACLSVSDTGCGLDDETQRKIFDPFFSTKFIGRGLGLSVTLGLVRAYEGAISVESRLGQGATFRVLFPLRESDSAGSLRQSGG